jgi:hypothetical protein
MPKDATRMRDRTGWGGSRRTLLSAAAGLCLPTLLPQGRLATPIPQPTPSGLRDFAYVCAALRLEAQERDDLKPLADVRLKASVLALTAEALVAAKLFAEGDARRIFTDATRQRYTYGTANTDASRLMLVTLVEATPPEGADDIFQLSTAGWRQYGPDQATPDLAPDADNAFLGGRYGAQRGQDPSIAYYWLLCGLRFGSMVAVWQVGFRTETPELALAVPINRLLRDYLTDHGTTARRGASLAFLLTVPEQPIISISQTVLEGTVLGYWDFNEAVMAKRQAEATSVGVVNELLAYFHGPDRLAPSIFIDEFASAEQARHYFVSLQHDQPANDQRLGVTRRALASDEFRLTGWDDGQASSFQNLRGQEGLLGVSVEALIDTFQVHVEVGDVVPADTATTEPGRDDPALRQWSAMAQRLLAPIPATAQHPPGLAARALFPPPLPAFAGPLQP